MSLLVAFCEEMNVIHLSLSHLFPAISLQEKAIVIFYAKWQPKALAKLINGLNQYPANNIEEIIAVQSVGGDDVESYVVDVLQVNVLPFIAIFNRKTLIGGGPSWIDVLQHLYLFRKPEIHWRKFQNEVDYISLLLGNFASNTLTLEDRSNDCLQLFISGDRSSVGKSTISLMILACLVSRGVPPENLAYIKPVTQCEAVQPVTKYCQSVGIETIEVSPIVFYQGFTRAYLAGETETAIEMLHRIRTVVSSISEGKRLVVIDGVGYPSVGSICSISNADVAQYLQAPVLLVGKSGVGDAVDSYNLLATFFEYHRVRVLGGIFNKIELEGFYSLENCKRSLSSYFLQRKPHQMPYGFMPKTTAFRGLEHLMIVDNGAESIDQLLLNGWLNVFLQHVDLQRIIFDTWMVKVSFCNKITKLLLKIVADVFFVKLGIYIGN